MTAPVDGASRTATVNLVLTRLTSTVPSIAAQPATPGLSGHVHTVETSEVLVMRCNRSAVGVRSATYNEPSTGAVTGEPDVVRKDTHAHAWALRMSPDGNVWGATVNKTAGDAEKLDDVVFPLFPQGGGFPRNNDDKT